MMRRKKPIKNCTKKHKKLKKKYLIAKMQKNCPKNCNFPKNCPKSRPEFTGGTGQVLTADSNVV